jgi:hypothetical protein
VISGSASSAESTRAAKAAIPPPRARVELIRYPAEAAGRAWPKARPLLAKAIGRLRGELAERHLFDAVLEDRAQLWIAYDDDGTSREPVAAAVTWITEHPTGLRTFDIGPVGGMRKDRWLPMESEFIAYARQQHCARIKSVAARPGWERELRHWRKTGVVLELAVTP